MVRLCILLKDLLSLHDSFRVSKGGEKMEKVTALCILWTLSKEKNRIFYTKFTNPVSF